MYLQKRCRLKLLLPYGTRVHEAKINAQNPKFQISQFFEQLLLVETSVEVRIHFHE